MKNIKNTLEYLEHHCDEISSKDFYRLIFPKGELEKKGEYVNGKYNAIAVSISLNKIKRYTVTDDLVNRMIFLLWLRLVISEKVEKVGMLVFCML